MSRRTTRPRSMWEPLGGASARSPRHCRRPLWWSKAGSNDSGQLLGPDSDDPSNTVKEVLGIVVSSPRREGPGSWLMRWLDGCSRRSVRYPFTTFFKKRSSFQQRVSRRVKKNARKATLKHEEPAHTPDRAARAWLVRWLEPSGRSMALKNLSTGVTSSDWPRRVPRFPLYAGRPRLQGPFGNEPPPGSGVWGQASVLPALSATLWRPGGRAESWAFSMWVRPLHLTKRTQASARLPGSIGFHNGFKVHAWSCEHLIP